MNPEFAVHVLSDDGLTKAADIASEFDALLDELKDILPEGRYLSIVKTKLEEACFFAKKAVAEANAA